MCRGISEAAAFLKIYPESTCGWAAWGLRKGPSRGWGVWVFRGSGVQGFRGLGVWGFRGLGVQGFRGLGV